MPAWSALRSRSWRAPTVPRLDSSISRATSSMPWPADPRRDSLITGVLLVHFGRLALTVPPQVSLHCPGCYAQAKDLSYFLVLVAILGEDHGSACPLVLDGGQAAADLVAA